MIEWCVDANIAIKWVISSEAFCAEANASPEYAETNGISLIALPTFPSEVDSDNVIRKHVFYGKMTKSDAYKAYMLLDQIPVEILEMQGMRQLARNIAERFSQKTVYDAT